MTEVAEPDRHEVPDVPEAKGESHLIPELTKEEEEEYKKEKERAKKYQELRDEIPTFPDYPLKDRVKEMKLDAGLDEDVEFYTELASKQTPFFFSFKNAPDSIAKKYIPELARRWIECEARIKPIENMLWELPREENSLEEDRFDILTEVLDKAAQGLDIWDEHVERKVRLGHRVHLEAKLLHLISTKFDIIEKVCGEFGKLKGDQHGANNEREWLRYEIRSADLGFCEVHEQFLRSYLDMDW